MLPHEATVDLLKIDIEGAEAEIFANCQTWISRIKNLMIELHSPYSEDLFLNDLKRANSALRVVESNIVSGNPLLFLSQ
jgi:hypothetical protein